MAQILDMNGQPIQRDVLDQAQTAQLSWLQYSFEEHPSRGMTPQRLARVLEDAERGYLIDQSDLFNDMEEKDAHIFSEMSKRKRVLLTLDWDIKPPRNASAAEQRLTEEVREWFQDLPSFEDMLLDCLDAIGHGFAALEIGWQQLGKMWFPQSFSHRPQRWFMNPWFDRNQIRLRGIGVDGEPLWPFGWVLHRHMAKSGYIGRAGLHRILAWPYLFKNYSVRDLAEFLEIYGLPLRVGKYPAGATDEEKRALLRAVAEIGHNAAGIIPDSMLLEFHEAAKGNGGHMPHMTMVEWCERSQSKAILGGTLTSQADGKSSTHALGNVHNEVRHDLMTSDARQIGGTLTRDIIYPMIVLNRGNIDPTRCPRLVFETQEPADLKLYAESLPKLVGIGLPITQKWALNKLAIPEPGDGDALLSIPQPAMALPPEERPLPAARAPNPNQTPPQKPLPRTAQTAQASRYRAVLVNERGEVVYPDQAALDEAASHLPHEALSAGMEKMLAPVITALKAGETPDAAIEGLLAAQPDMDEAQIAELLARALFVADIWGRLNGGH